MSKELDAFLNGGWAGGDSGGGDQQQQQGDKSWWDTFSENAGNAWGQVQKLPQGLWNLGSDIVTTGKNLADIPSTVTTQGLERLGVDQGAAENLGRLAAMQTGIGAGQNLADALSHNPNPSVVNPELTTPGDNRERFNTLFPAVGKLEQGFEQTGQRVIPEAMKLTPLGLAAQVTGNGRFGPDPYLEAWRQGDLATPVIQDAANLALVADLAGGAVGETSQAARAGATAAEGGQATFNGALDQAVGTRLAPYAPQLEDVSATLNQGASLANKVAGAPINAATAPLRLPLRWAQQAAVAPVAELGATAGGLTEDTLSRYTNAADISPNVGGQETPGLGPIQQMIDRSRFAQGTGQRLSSLGDLTLGNQVTRGTRGELQANAAAEFKQNAGEVQPNDLLAGNPTEGATALAMQTGLLTPETANLIWARQQAGAELPKFLTPEMMDVAQQHYSGANPELSQRLNTLGEDWRNAAAQHEEMYTQGQGAVPAFPAATVGGGGGTTEIASPLRAAFDRNVAETVGRAPMENAIQRAIDNPTQAAADGFLPKNVADEIDTLKGKSNPEAVARMDQIREQMRDMPSFAPPDLRPAVELRQNLVESSKPLVEELRAKGDHGTADTLEEAMGQVATTLRDAEAQGQLPPSMHVHYGAPEANPQLSSLRAKPLTYRAGSQMARTGDMVNLDPRYQWARYLEDTSRRYTNQTAQQIAETTGWRAPPGMPVKDAVATAAERGMVAYDPERLGSPLSSSSVNENTIFLPKPVMRAFEDMQKHLGKSGGVFDAALKATDKGTSAWKTLLLPLSPKWMLGHTIGNEVMAATVPGAVSPRAIAGAVEAYRNPDLMAQTVMERGGTGSLYAKDLGTLGEGYNPADIQAALKSSPAQSVRELISEGAWGQAAKKAAGNLVNAPRQVVEFAGKIGHLQVMTALKLERDATMNELDSQLKAGRITESAYKQATSRLPSDEAIIEKSAQTIGDMKNMSWQERELVRRAVPFYAWTKHLTQLAWKLPFDNPYRVAWTLNLANIYNDKDWQNRSDFYKGDIRLGNGNSYLGMPFNLLGEGTDSRLLSPPGAIGALSPLVQWPAAAFGWNMRKFKPLSQAPTGKDQTPGQFIGWGPLAGYLAGQVPQFKTAQSLGGQPIVRYDTGQPWMIGGKPKPLNQVNVGPVPSPLAQFLTGATVEQPDIAAEQAKAQKQQLSLAKQALKYQARRTRFGV